MPKRLALLGLLALASPAWAGFMAGPAPEIPDDVVLPVASTPVGAVGVDAFTGWTNAATSISQSNANTSPSTNIHYITKPSGDEIIATTVDEWRDVEVTTYATQGCAVLRYKDGVAVTFKHNINVHLFSVNIERGITAGTHGGNECLNHAATNGYVRLYETLDPAADIPGYNTTATQNDEFTFGCVGWTCYAKFNGTEFWNSGADIRIPIEAGAVAVSGFAVRETSVTWLPLATINSRPAGQIYDMADFGFYAVETTGSITSGSDDLTVASSAGYEVGDEVIVECGYESGACARNTVGVGGTWPAAHYADDAAMDAAVPCTANSFAYLEDSGKVRRCASNGASWAAWSSSAYYLNTMVPRALSATITAISGNVLTLDTTASATATNANVYRDSTDYMGMFVNNAGNSIFTPFGTYRFSPRTVIQGEATLYLKDEDQGQSVTIEGAGLNKDAPAYTFYYPNGAPAGSLKVTEANGVVVSGVYVRSNGGTSKYGLHWTTNGVTGFTYPYGIRLALLSDGQLLDSGAENTLASSADTSYCTRCIIDGAYSRMTFAQPIYVGNWKISQADSTDGEIRDSEVDSDWLINGYEIFRSDNVDVIDSVGRNAIFASNSSGGGWLIDNLSLTIEQNSQGSSFVTASSPVVSINSNIAPPNPSMSEGGTIRNITLVNNYINVSNDLMIGIVVNIDNPNITIEGTYPSCVSPKGLISYPDASVGGGLAINSTGQGTTITGIRADGTNLNATWGDIALTVNTGQSITDSVADNVTGIGTETDVITNSAYEALCPRRRRPANDNRRGVTVASRRRRTRLAA